MEPIKEPDILKEQPHLRKYWNNQRKNNWDYGTNPYGSGRGPNGE